MKKTTVLLAALTLLLLLTSCLPDTPLPPPGVWMSEEPKIILFFDPEDQIQGVGTPSFFGVYILDGVETKIFTQFGPGLTFRIFDLTEPRKGGGQAV